MPLIINYFIEIFNTLSFKLRILNIEFVFFN